MIIDIKDPLPGQYEYAAHGDASNIPSEDSLGHALVYYAWTMGPIGLLDPGNALEMNYWAQKFGWKGAAAVTLVRATGLPILYGIIFDPDHVYSGGLDDSNLGIADNRRRTMIGKPMFVHEGYVGNPQAWAPTNRVV